MTASIDKFRPGFGHHLVVKPLGEFIEQRRLTPQKAGFQERRPNGLVSHR